MLKETINWNKAHLYKVIIAPGVLKKGEVRKLKDVMEIAYQTGVEVIKDNC